MRKKERKKKEVSIYRQVERKEVYWGMNLWSFFCTCGKEDTVRDLAVINVHGSLSSFGITLKNHPLFEWCIKYAQEEGVQPVISCLDRKLKQWCNSRGLDFFSPQIGYSLLDTIKHLITFYPADIIYVLDPAHPILPRGILRSMKAYLLSEDIASISAGGASAYDVRTIIKSNQLSPFSSHISLPVPEICNYAVSSVQKKPELQGVYDPWFSPDSISVTIENTQIDPEPIWQSDLKVKIDIPLASPSPLSIPWDTIISDKLPTPTSTYTLEDLGWSSDAYVWKRLSPMAQTILFFSLIYPKAKISWHGDISYNPMKEAIRNAKSREQVSVLGNNFIMEKTFWKQVNVSVGRINTDAAFPDPDKCDKLTVTTPNWSDTVIVDAKSERGGRLANKDSFTVLSYTPNDYLSVKWDRYGIESFKKKKDANIWEKV